MRRPLFAVLVALGALGAPRTATPQEPAPPPRTDSVANSADSGADSAAASAPRPWAVYTGVSNVYDSNINHSQLGLTSYGLLAVLGGQYRQRFSKTTVELQYDGVFRQYTHTNAWDRPGHDAVVSVDQRLGRRWTAGAEAEVALNGSAEDRVLRNEYSVQPQVEYRFDRSTRLLLYGEYLLKRYPNPTGQDATDPRVGVRLRRLFGTRGSFSVGGRYEYNKADSSRSRYAAWTAGSDFTRAAGSGRMIQASVRYRTRRYTSRLVKIGGNQVLRRDGDLVATAGWQQVLFRLWEVDLSYRYEHFHSNDTSKAFQEHLVGLTVKRWW